MKTQMLWLYKDDPAGVLIHPSDIVGKIFSLSMGIGSATPDGNGSVEAPYTMASVAQWFGAARSKNPAAFTWYRIGGRMIRRDFAPEFPDYMADGAHLDVAAPSYPTLARDIHTDARAFPPTETAFSYYSTSLVARQIRGLLRGHNELRIMNWEGIPVLVATMFIAELSRNPSTFIITMMLLDLIQKEWPFEEFGILDWETVLWRDTLRATDMYNKTAGAEQRKGGVHPMARLESVKQSKEILPKSLSRVHQMEAAIAMNWLKAKAGDRVILLAEGEQAPSGQTGVGIKSAAMTSAIASERNQDDLNNWKIKVSREQSLKPNQKLALTRQAVLNAEIGPLLRERGQSFDYLL